jgi:hypothetical protein
MSVRFEVQAEPIPGYRLLDRLGAGGFGEVWRCEAPGGIFKAVKIIHGDLRSRDNDLVRYAEQELKALKRVKQVRHPYLLALDRYDIIEGRLMIVMELADCNLWDRFRACRDRGLPGIPRDELMQYMAESAEVLDLFNDQFQLQHLDIKPQNLFMLHNHVKVADFGQVKDLQGLIAQVTGGITPVYAAPETFDGIITRFCDQYSLACVYQELLTGVRPFDGCSINQLLMQHLNLPPNLEPSPPADRPALLRALAKRPDDRWPSVTAFVRALAGGSGGSAIHVRLGAPAAEADTPRVIPPATEAGAVSLPAPPLPLPADDTPARMAEHFGPIFTPAPPELTGPGPLRPAVVIGLGQGGLRVLQRLRFEMAERFGPANLTPAVRTLFIDTDPEDIEEAGRARLRDRLAALSPDEIFPAKLQRAGHYLKPRFNGRTLTEGWFDPQLLYRLPRAPQTMGLRLLGRLAFLDHYRQLMAKVQSEIEAALAPDALALTEARTGLARRTNRPRIYLAGGLAGATCGGTFIDLAYAIRSRLKRMGYDVPDVVGLFVLPPADATLTPPQQLGNAYAALTELNHFSRPDTVFTAHYDERNGYVKDKDAPFTRCYLLPGAAAGLVPYGGAARRTPPSIPSPGGRGRGSGSVGKPGSRVVNLNPAPQPTPDPGAAAAALRPFGDAAERVRLDLFAAVGRTADAARELREALEQENGPPRRGPVTVSAFGLACFDWPRAEVVGRTALLVGRKLLHRWATPDPRRFHEAMPGVAANRWSQLGFDPDAVAGRFQRAADLAAGGKVDELIGLLTEPLVPRGWLARLPEPQQVALALESLNRLVGPPASTVKRPPTAVEEALARSANGAAESFASDLENLLPALADDPQFRLAGAEELYRQFLVTADRLLERFGASAAELEAKALAGFELLAQYAHFQKGMRKPTAVDLADALRQYPRARLQALAHKQLLAVYQAAREALVPLLAEVSGARQRVAAAAAAVPDGDSDDPPASFRRLMPPGCATVGDAVDRFVKVLTDGDLVEIDRRVQAILGPEAGGLLRVCVNSSGGIGGVVGVLFEEARAHLDARLGEVGLASMFAERFRTAQQAERAIGQAYQEAEPAWIGGGPWAAGEVAVLACPPGGAGEPLREVARRAVPVAGLPVADSRDDLTIYREWPAVPLSALPHLGPSAAAAYDTMPEATQCSAHSRLDVTRWIDVDAD